MWVPYVMLRIIIFTMVTFIPIKALTELDRQHMRERFYPYSDFWFSYVAPIDELTKGKLTDVETLKTNTARTP